MNKRIVQIGILAAAIWVVAGAFAAADAGVALIIVNKAKEARKVEVYSDGDDTQLIPCWSGEIKGGEEITVPAETWPWSSCGWHEKYAIRVLKPVWNPTRSDTGGQDWGLDNKNTRSGLNKGARVVLVD